MSMLRQASAKAEQAVSKAQEAAKKAGNLATDAAMKAADEAGKRLDKMMDMVDPEMEQRFAGFMQYTATVKKPTVPEGIPEGAKPLQLYEGMILLVHGFAEGEWLVCSYEDAGAGPLDKQERVDGVVHTSCILSMHDELSAMQKEALKADLPRRVAIYPFGSETASKVGKNKPPQKWPWEKIADRRPISMEPGNVLEVIDSQLAPWLHCRLVGVDGPAGKGYCPEGYSLDVLDYVDMMKAWETEILNNYAQEIGMKRPRSPRNVSVLGQAEYEAEHGKGTDHEPEIFTVHENNEKNNDK